MRPEAWVSLLLEGQGLLGEAAQGSYEGVNGVARVIEQLAGLSLPVRQSGLANARWATTMAWSRCICGSSPLKRCYRLFRTRTRCA